MSVPDSYALPTNRSAGPTNQLPPSPIVSTNLATPSRALAIGAHPDDIEFGCGGTLAKWAANGCEVFHLVLTDGSKGTWDPDVDQAELVITRQREQRVAARELGGGRKDADVVFLGWIDGELDAGLRQRWEVAFWIRKFQPDVVLGHDPWRRYRIHPDHRNAGFLTTDAIVAARDPKFFPEQNVAPHRPSSLLLWEADEADHVEEVSDDHLNAKVRALLAHESQYGTTMRISNGMSSSEVDAFASAVAERASEAGSLAGIATGEAFKLINRL